MCQQQLDDRRDIIVNIDVKVAATRAGIKLWQVAEALGIADSSLSRKLRRELPEDEKTKIMEIISDLKAGAEQ